MPQLPDVPSVVKAELEYTLGIDLTVATRYFLKYSGGAPDATGLNGWCTAIATSWVTHMAAMTAADTILTSVRVTDLTATTAHSGVAIVTHPGTRAGSPLAAATALLLNFTVDRRYRGGKPRMYHPAGVAADLANAQTWTPAFTTAFAAAWTAFQVDVNAGYPGPGTIGAQVSVSYYHLFDPFKTPSGRYKNISRLRDGGPLVDNVTSVKVNPSVSSQRRRQSL